MSKKCKIKFCGMKDNNALGFAVSLGVNYLGFIVDFPKSPRNISIDEFNKKIKWLRKTHQGNYKVVAVTVDMPLNKLEYLMEEGMADIMQLHGNEHFSICRQVKSQMETWKAISQKHKKSNEEILTLAKSVDRVVLDSGNAVEKAFNTSGAFNDMELYNLLVNEGINVVLSGGINAGNVKEYLEKYEPSVIDISRGIESEPGVKSKPKMQELIDAVNQFYSFGETLERRKNDEEE
jgi:phosphoribosylanthranilate isomerase